MSFMGWIHLANAILLVVVSVMLLVTMRRKTRQRVTYNVDPIERLSYGVEHLANVWQENAGTTSLQEQTYRQIRKTCIDIQGAIEIYARWAVAKMPHLLEDMEPPKAWTQKTAETSTVTFDLNGCARCHGDGHKQLEFRRLTHPMVPLGAPPDKALTHWALCPTNGEPILMLYTDMVP